MAEKTVKALPLVPAQYDSVNESINRRTIEQALQDLYSEVGHVKDMQESGISKAVKRHIFLLMGASHCCFNGGSISMMLTALAGIKLPDNEKIFFGDSDDLQIWHSGTDSIIKDTGVGGIKIDSNYTAIRSANGSETSAKFLENSAVELYYDNVKKVETTSSGIDVSGRLDVAQDLRLRGNSSTPDVGVASISIADANGSINFDAGNDGTNMSLTSTGLGIGTTPSNPLHVYHATTDTVANFESGDASVAVNFTASDNSMQIATSGTDGIIKNNGAGNFRLFNNGSERARIDSNGKLGANTTSLDGILTLKQLANSDSNGLDGIRIDASSGTTYAGFGLANATGTLAITAGDAGGAENTEIVFKTASSGSESEVARFTSAGRLGINTSAPSYALDVHDNANILLKLASTTATNNARMVFSPNNNDKWNIGVQYANDNFTFYDITNNLTPFRIEQGAGENTLMVDVNSRVGMGLNNPATRVHIQDDSSPVLRVEDSTNNVKTDIGATDTQGYIGTQTAHPFMLRYENVDSYRFDAFKQMYHGNTTNADRLMTGGNLLPYQYLDTRDYMRRRGHHASSDFVVFLHANDHEIVPYLDNTNIYLNGDLIHSNVSAFTQVVIPNASLSLYDIISANKPISVSQDQPRQYASPISFGGQVLCSFATRYYPQDFLLYSPYSKVDYEIFTSSSATVDISGTPVATGTIDYKSGVTVNVAGSGTTYYIIKATGHIVGMKRGTGGDNMLLPPIGQEVISNAQATSVIKINDGTNSSSTTSTSNGGARYYRENRGDRDLGIGAFGTADGAGGDAEFGIPLEFLSDYYIYNETTITNFRLVSYKSNQIQVLDKNGNRLYQYDHTDATKEVLRFQEEGTASGGGPDLSTNGPFRFIGTSPFHLVCQSTGDLECVLLGALQDEVETKDNYLDYYSEGTFTLTTAGDATGAFNGTPTCHYTKIGNMVTVLISFRVGTNFSSNEVGGLPFATSHSGMVSNFINAGQVVTSTSNTISATVGNGVTNIRLHNNQNTGDSHNPNTTAEYYRLNFTYRAA